MKILAVDIGTGTQDILLFDSRLDIENSIKLVLPSPTMIIRNRLRAATHARRPVILTGVTMGGGPSQWAAEDHIRAGLPVFATPPAARSFNDDLTMVEQMGIRIVSEDEVKSISDKNERIELKDFDFTAIQKSLAEFGVGLDDLDAVAVAVFDHGAAPPDISDRKFRFDYLDERIRGQNRLSAFAYKAEDIPTFLTRLEAVVQSSGNLTAPLVVMDTAPAAVLGASFDPLASRQERVLIANVGNFHTLAFRLGPAGIEAVFEHHTGLLDQAKLEKLVKALAAGNLRNEDVFDDHGHGALVYTDDHLDLSRQNGSLVVTGPRRSMLFSSSLTPYFAVPFGDMMLAGCFGLLSAVADLMPELRTVLTLSMGSPSGSNRAPWDE
jgi:uncharacterized protein (DUF1786 family)